MTSLLNLSLFPAFQLFEYNHLYNLSAITNKILKLQRSVYFFDQARQLGYEIIMQNFNY